MTMTEQEQGRQQRAEVVRDLNMRFNRLDKLSRDTLIHFIFGYMRAGPDVSAITVLKFAVESAEETQ